MTNFKIRTFGRTELAQLYCPELCPQAAFRKLNQWIDLYPNLREELACLRAFAQVADIHARPGRTDCRGIGRTGRELTPPGSPTHTNRIYNRKDRLS